VQFEGMGVAAGPPARLFGVGAGWALTNDNVLTTRSSREEGNVNIILQLLENETADAKDGTQWMPI